MCRCEAVVEIAELLELAPAQVQDTLSFYGFFKQDAAARRNAGLGLPLDQLRAARRRRSARPHVPARPAFDPGETTADGKLTLEFGECLGACEFAPCMLAGDTLHKNLTNESAEAFLDEVRQDVSGNGQQ